MEKNTYLLGAGASANVLPLIKGNKKNNIIGLPGALSSFIRDQKTKILEDSNWNEGAFQQMTEISEKCDAFGTPDLAAKYYLETGNDHYYRLLKILLSHYFHYTENRAGNGFEGKTLDFRVVPFLTTILNKKKLPEGLKILSWNYDTQIEKGRMMLAPSIGTNDYFSNFNVWPFNAEKYNRTVEDYFLLHLNGISGNEYSPKSLCEEITNPLNFGMAKEPLISFAWEDDETFQKKTFTERRLQLAQQMITGTSILVVIGYSFPFFNRKIDAELFSYIKPTLHKIYFQDPNLDGQFLYNQFGLFKTVDEIVLYQEEAKPVNIVHIKDVDQYYVPFEL